MSNAVTLSTAGEVLQHLGRMRGAMAIQAAWKHLVFFLVAGGALQATMLALACLQQLEGISMTGGALC